MQNPQDVQLAASSLLEALPEWVKPDFLSNAVGIILGTGLSAPVLKIIQDSGDKWREVEFSRIAGFPQSGVQSHAGSFLCGRIAGCPVMAQLGRCHLYEGRAPEQVCMGVRVMAELGIRTLIITNAAGALNPLLEPGTLMCMADMINHTGVSPLAGANHDAWGDRFPDMSEPFDKGLEELALRGALECGIRLERGVYIGVHGPEMETPAETRMYRLWGADAVGMSTVLEVIAARHVGMKVLGISCLTNKNLPDCMRPAPLSEVIEVAGRCGEPLAKLIMFICKALAPGGSRKNPHETFIC